MGGQSEAMHPAVLERTEGCISSQAVQNGGIKKATPEELCVTLFDKKGCFACNERSHNLNQCKIKYKLVSAAHQFGYATRFPFTIIQPSDEMIEKKKFYRHCVLIKSNVTNLDKGILKDELNMFWKLSGDWELRRECDMTFMASFSSEDDVISCLNKPKVEKLPHNKEVKLDVTRWKENEDGSLDLVEEWLLVRGIPRIYRNWKELYQVASAFGVLMDVDEESLEVGDKESIRLKTAIRSFDGAPFSYHFAFGWSSKLVMVTAVQDKTKGMKHKNKELDKEHKKEPHAAKNILLEEPKGIEESRSNVNAKENKISAPATTIMKITITESSKPIAPSPQSMSAEEHFRGIQKPKGTEESRSNGKAKENKIIAPSATITNSEKTKIESIVLEEPKGIEESISNENAKENKISAPTATIMNSEAIITESLKPIGVESIAPPSLRRMIGEEHLRGIQRPAIKYVYQRRGKKQQVTEAIIKSPSNKMDKEVAPHSNSNAMRTGASTGCDMLDEKDYSEMEPKRELNMEEINPVEESKKSEKLGACIETEYSNVAAPKIKKKSQISGSRTPHNELINRHTKGVRMDQMGSGIEDHKKEEHTFDMQSIQQLVETLNVSMEDAEKIYMGKKEIPKAEVAYEYTKAKDLMATKREIKDLSPAMRKLHDYYLADTVKAGCSSFGVCIPKHYIFEKEEEEIHWVEYAALFQLFQRRDLDLQTMMIWTLLEAKYCLKKGLDHIAFLDPVRVNENTCKGIHCNVKDLVDELTKIFYRIKHKSNILLAYNCMEHYVLVDIKFAESRVEVWDSKRGKLSQINYLLKVLNDVKKNMDGDRMIQFEAHYMEAHTLEQPMANNECGFYVMWAMHQYLGGNMTEGNQMRNELKTQQLLDMEIRRIQDELADFINDEVMSREGSFNIWKAKNRSSFDVNMF